MTKDEALKLALEALHGFIPYLPLNDEAQCGRYDKAIASIDKALKKPEQEPVGWAEHGVINWLADKQFNHTSFLYDTPAQRKWIGLTAMEMEGLYESATYMDETDYIHLLMMAEAKLKETAPFALLSLYPDMPNPQVSLLGILFCSI